MAGEGIFMPSSSGGLMRYNEEFVSKFKLTPIQVIIFLIVIVVFIYVLKIFWPISA